VIALIFILRAFAQPPPDCTNWKFCVTINPIKPDNFLPLNTGAKGDFDKALCKLKKTNGGDHNITFLDDTPNATPIDNYTPPPTSGCKESYASIKTDKVTKSELADSAAAANDPNAVHYLYSNNAADIHDVLKTFK